MSLEREGASSSVSPDEAPGRQTGNGPDSEMLHDALIYPGLYSPSGFDMMGILVC